MEAAVRKSGRFFCASFARAVEPRLGLVIRTKGVILLVKVFPKK